jgi:hypothetical protein
VITTTTELEQARNVLYKTESALASLRSRIEPSNPALFRAMSESYVRDILSIRSDIDAFIGTTIAQEGRAQLWISLNGYGLDGSSVPTRTLVSWLDRIRKVVLNVSDYIYTKEVRTTGRPSSMIADSTDLRVVALERGSIRIGVCVPDRHEQQVMFDEMNSARAVAIQAIEKILELARWAQSAGDNYEETSGVDQDELVVVASQLIDLVPSSRSIVSTVTFMGALVPSEHEIKIDKSTLQPVMALINRLSKTTNEVIIGTIREIDLDAQRLILRERGEGNPDVKCFIPDELMTVAESLLDKTVQVRGTVASLRPNCIDVKDITQWFNSEMRS